MSTNEDIFEGLCCSLCGEYFVDPEEPNTLYMHDYPVACERCWSDSCGYDKATAKTINPFTKYP